MILIQQRVQLLTLLLTLRKSSGSVIQIALYITIVIDNIPLKPLTIDDTYKYLGIEIGPIDNKNNTIVIDLTSKLISINKALLKPQQKLDILKSYLLPSLLHRLTFSNI